MTPEAKLAALLAAAEPPARDFAFEAEVARRVALRRAWLSALAFVPWALIASLLLWAIARTVGPELAEMTRMLAPLAYAVLIAAGAAAGAFWGARSLNAA